MGHQLTKSGLPLENQWFRLGGVWEKAMDGQRKGIETTLVILFCLPKLHYWHLYQLPYCLDCLKEAMIK